MLNRFTGKHANVLLRFKVPHLCFSLVTASIVSLSSSVQADTTHQISRPNILLIVADDLGYSDLSAFGSEIQTPNIDALAKQGRILTNFHTAAVCSPTRSSLMTGVDHHLAGIGNMGEVVGLNIVQDQPINAPWGKSNTYDFDNIPDQYDGHLSKNTETIAELLSDAGYHTYMVGKWHLAYDVKAPDAKHKRWFRIDRSALPYARGFEKSFTLIDGGGSHYAPPAVPTPLDLTMYADNDHVFPAKQLPKNFYSTTFYTHKLIDYIDSSKKDGKPFFAYAAYTAPHWPLQAPQADIDAQKGRYDVGYDVIKAQRLERMKKLGLLKDVIKPDQGQKTLKHWDQLTPEEKQKSARLMEIYAAMVSNLDRNVGKLIAHLKAIHEYDNTLIMFMSDNGAEGAPAFQLPIPGTKVNNSLENMGRPGSVVAYGANWAQVSSAPFKLFKGFTGAEGGTSSPFIVKLNGETKAKPTSDARVQVTDIVPTLLAAANVSLPGKEYKGRKIYQPTGMSFLPELKENTNFSHIHKKGTVLADELMGASYVVRDQWKLAQQPSLGRKPVLRKDVPFALYDITKDRGETQDVASQHPELVEALKADYQEYVKKNKVLEQAASYNGR